MIKKELALIIKAVSDGDILYISEHILEEATRVFMKKFPEYLEIFKKFIRLSEIKIIRKRAYEKRIKAVDDIRDRYDAHVIACAEAKDCDYSITGDKDILAYAHDSFKSITSSEYLRQG